MDSKNRLMMALKKILGNISWLRDNHRKLLKYYLNFKHGLFGEPQSTKVMEKDWDFLIVLDACRYDMFEEINWIDGELQKINSAGSSTTEWIKNNFYGSYEDTVVVSSNPHLSDFRLNQIIGHNPFYYIEDVWDHGWDEELKTVHPKTVNKAVNKIIGKYKEKRVLIHYMQPHFPFIGESQIVHSGVDTLRKQSLGSDFKKKDERNPWDDLAEGKVSLEEFMRAYNSNLKMVLKYVERLLPHLEGKIIITSDHGNCIGEYGLHSHPGGIHIPPLLEVPWFEVEKE